MVLRTIWSVIWKKKNTISVAVLNAAKTLAIPNKISSIATSGVTIGFIAINTSKRGLSGLICSLAGEKRRKTYGKPTLTNYVPTLDSLQKTMAP